MMADVVTATNEVILPTLQQVDSSIVGINYQFGHLKELIATMQQYERAPSFKAKKYPLVALFLDFPENMGKSGGYPGACNLQMLIAMSTDPKMKTFERYENNFKPILYPIYYELIRQLDASNDFVVQSAKKVDNGVEDHPYYGKGGLADTAGNVFADCIDAILINTLNLTINFNPQNNF
jgi:hypothetical protein